MVPKQKNEAYAFPAAVSRQAGWREAGGRWTFYQTPLDAVKQIEREVSHGCKGSNEKKEKTLDP